MDGTDRRLLAELEKGLPLVREPFGQVGARLGLTGDEVLLRLRRLRAEGILRRFRARINQQRLGITANALVAWRVPAGHAAPVGRRLAAFPTITHCYQRRPVPGRWEYVLYTVHHGHSRGEVLEQVGGIACGTGLREYEVLFSTREFKRAPAVRIGGNGGGIP